MERRGVNIRRFAALCSLLLFLGPLGATHSQSWTKTSTTSNTFKKVMAGMCNYRITAQVLTRDLRECVLSCLRDEECTSFTFDEDWNSCEMSASDVYVACNDEKTIYAKDPWPTMFCTGVIRYYEHGPSCIMFIEEPLTWSDAQKRCNGMNGQLITMETAEKHLLLEEMSLANEGNVCAFAQAYWIGVHITTVEVLGVVFYTRLPYSAWVFGEPDRSGTCVRQVTGCRWRDSDCLGLYPSICEILI